jgi:3-hydroxy-3-methylglutaryl CoA synthase
MRGIISWGAYLPYRRLDRTQISAFIGQGGGRGTRTVASFDEDTTTMGVEAARLALRGIDPSKHTGPDALMFGTALPAYADRTNATAIHAALRLPPEIPAFDMGSSVGSATGALRMGLSTIGDRLIVLSDMRTGLAGSADEAAGGDAAAAFVLGEGDAVVAEYLGGASITEEFLDRWRAPGEIRSKVWDDKFSEVTYVKAGRNAYANALAAAGLEAGQVDLLAVAAPTARIGSALAGKLGAVKVVDDLTATVGATGAAQPGLVLANALEQAEPGQVIALVVCADGAEVMFLRATDAIARFTPARTISDQLESGAPLAYGRFLSWRGMINVEPPRRPEPARPSGTASARSGDWKFGFVGSRDTTDGMVFMPPSRVSFDGTRTDEMEAAPMADVVGTIATFTVDRLAYSPSPPIVFAVVDFDGGGRLPIELTDTDADEVAIGGRVEMTFRRLFTADGIHNYFWKGKLIRG